MATHVCQMGSPFLMLCGLKPLRNFKILPCDVQQVASAASVNPILVIHGHRCYSIKHSYASVRYPFGNAHSSKTKHNMEEPVWLCFKKDRNDSDLICLIFCQRFRVMYYAFTLKRVHYFVHLA